MGQDVLNVQKEGVVSTETTSQNAETTTTSESAQQLSQADILKELKAVQAKLAETDEGHKREIQSLTDSVKYLKELSRMEVDRANRRVKATEVIHANTLKSVVGDDPELQKTAKLAQLEAEKLIASQVEYEDMSHRQQAEFDQNFKDTHTQLIKDLGLDPEDKRIDWGDGEGSYMGRMKRIQKSIAKIAVEKYSAAEKRLKEIEDKEKKAQDEEANSVSTEQAHGASSDADFLKAYAAGESKDHKRAKKILNI